jgi:rhodanese-related sulfurtransferase
VPMDFINQNILLIGIVFVSGLGLLWPLLVRGAGKRVGTAEATQLINREDARILDVRESSEFAAGHLPEAKNIPLAKLSEQIGEIEKFKDHPLIVCCATGMRSGKACADLQKQGFAKLYTLDGGVDAWVGAGLPIKKGVRGK